MCYLSSSEWCNDKFDDALNFYLYTKQWDDIYDRQILISIQLFNFFKIYILSFRRFVDCFYNHSCVLKILKYNLFYCNAKSIIRVSFKLHFDKSIILNILRKSFKIVSRNFYEIENITYHYINYFIISNSPHHKYWKLSFKHKQFVMACVMLFDCW